MAKEWQYAVVGFIVGIIMAIAIAGSWVFINQISSGGMQGGQMACPMMFNNLSGNDFDKAFLYQMIMHHQMAVQMSQLAKNQAKHDELKKLADDIINSQSREIDLMKQWQKSWGYI